MKKGISLALALALALGLTACSTGGDDTRSTGSESGSRYSSQIILPAA